jgi:hypothetical protein
MPCKKKDPNDSAGNAAKAPAIEWDKNRTYHLLLVQKINEDPALRRGLFAGDSTSDAKEDGRKKIQGKDGKMVLLGELAEFVFDNNKVPTNVRAGYKANPVRFVRSTKQYLARYVGLTAQLDQE